jgi:dienelactone hydrolase
VTVPENWDGDLVAVNHGFDLNGDHIRPHGVCASNIHTPCACDDECGTPGGKHYCNIISYLGLDEILLPKGKAVAASTYSKTGWAVFGSARDIKEMLAFVKKTIGKPKRVIVTGFSGGGAVTGDATLKLKIDGAVPMCAAVGGGLPTWDLATDVRLIYDFVCKDVVSGRFGSYPDMGQITNPFSSGNDAISMALTVDRCLGVIGFATHTPAMDVRLADFIALTGFTGGAANVAPAMGFATLGMGDFVNDPDRLKGKRIGLNTDLDYSTMGGGGALADSFDTGVARLTSGPGRKGLSKASNPDFTKGKGKKVAYPILSMAGANDWLVIPEFQRVYDSALADGGKAITQTWTDPFGHCVFTPEEITALFTKYFEWLGPVGGPNGPQPTAQDIEDACLAIPGAVDGDDCNFNSSFLPDKLSDRIPARPDWPLAATK